jgi:hypothetical protein
MLQETGYHFLPAPSTAMSIAIAATVTPNRKTRAFILFATSSLTPVPPSGGVTYVYRRPQD